MGAVKASELAKGCNGLNRGYIVGIMFTWGCSFVICAGTKRLLLIKGLFLASESCSLACEWLLRHSSSNKEFPAQETINKELP